LVLNQIKYKKIIGIVVIIMLILTGRVVYKQWQLLQNFVKEKGGNMQRSFHEQVRYLQQVEEITARILLEDKVVDDLYKQSDRIHEQYERFKYTDSLERYGGKDRIHTGDLREFYYLVDDFFVDFRDQRIQLTKENIQFIKNVHEKSVGLNRICDQYRPYITRTESTEMFYSEDLANAMKKMNDLCRECLQSEWNYTLDRPTKVQSKKSTKIQRNKPTVGDVFGKEILSEDEAKSAVQDFLQDFGKIVGDAVGKGESRYDENVFLKHVSFETDTGYKIRVYNRGGKIKWMIDKEWNDIEEDIQRYKEAAPNISKEEAVKKLMDFLLKRGFDSLEVIEAKQYGRELKVVLAKVEDGYTNMATNFDASLDLGREGKITELSFSGYWEGLQYDDMEYEKALAGYEKAKKALKLEVVIEEEKLVGMRGNSPSLNFCWRFKTMLNGQEYFIYVDALTGEKTNIKKVFQ
jgi:uncharacterized membrane protein YkoI